MRKPRHDRGGEQRQCAVVSLARCSGSCRVAVAVAAVAALMRRTAISERMTRGGVWQSTRVGGVGREGGQEGRAGWAVRAGADLLLHSERCAAALLQHRCCCCAAVSAVAALCACARARECRSVLRQECVSSPPPRYFVQNVRECVSRFVTDCRNHQPSPLLFYGSHSASHMTR
jgi:hypothetical protein